MEYFSWILTIWGLIGFWFVGSKKKYGWLINIACQPVWIIYSIYSKQYGFLLSALFYTIVFTRNYLKG